MVQKTVGRKGCEGWCLADAGKGFGLGIHIVPKQAGKPAAEKEDFFWFRQGDMMADHAPQAIIPKLIPIGKRGVRGQRAGEIS